MLTSKDKDALAEVIIGGVPLAAALVIVEQIVQEHVAVALRENGVFSREG